MESPNATLPPTPTPWLYYPGSHSIYGNEAKTAVCILCGPHRHHEKQDANAEFIVRACNAHDDLVAALTHLLECGRKDLSNPKYDGYFDTAREALNKATP